MNSIINCLLDGPYWNRSRGARRLGEVALVPHSSPISKIGNLTPEQIAAQGGNKSLIHIDWMIGRDRIDIDGVHADGRRVPVFRKGEWA